MTIEEIKTVLNSSDYDFLRTNEHLGNNIAILTVGGSHAYGTATETSDLDIRGCTLNSKMQILAGGTFEQFTHELTDTTIYGFNKLISLLINVNPNVIEMLGNRPENYYYISPIGQELIDNSHLFLSKKVIHSFGGYATQQLRRLENKSNRLVEQSRQEEHILKTIEHVSYTFNDKFTSMPDDALRLYIDTAVQEGFDTEIFMDIHLTHYPLRDYNGMLSDLQNIVREYGKIGKRNTNEIKRDKLGKHMMHLIRLYMMCLDLLEREQIVTYREKERDFLMDIRNGKYLDNNDQPVSEFYDMVDDYEKKLDYAKTHTNLPDQPNYTEIKEFVASVNERIVLGTI